METDPRTQTPDYEPEDTIEDAHEHGVVFHQVEDEIPLLAEDGDDPDDLELDV